ncbi:unnamed protein product [Rhizophagus irregularis]|uniref:non-specific serine/threonine protein kinase n=1 Tax=Rhizophagus irregularis TaxID=588596 RepID=A0A915ZFD3_9GLOM|nr:unnamed protein product [Rhizophagus irregularis]
MCSIIKAGRLFNEYLSKLIEALELPEHDFHRNSVIQTELDNFANEPDLKVNVGDNLNIISDKILSKRSSQVCSISPTEIDGEFFKTTIRSLNNKIYLYHEHQLNNHDYIIKFHGYSVYSCKPILFYDHAEYGDLFAYFQVNHRSSNLLKDWRDKIKLAWEITQGIKYLHNQKILHLDLRSANILLEQDGIRKTLIPKYLIFCGAETYTITKLLKNNQETMPKLPIEYQRWKDIVNKMCQFKSGERNDIGSVEIIMRNLYKGRSGSMSSISTDATYY